MDIEKSSSNPFKDMTCDFIGIYKGISKSMAGPKGELAALLLFVAGFLINFWASLIGIHWVLRYPATEIGFWSHLNMSFWHFILVPGLLYIATKQFYFREGSVIESLVRDEILHVYTSKNECLPNDRQQEVLNDLSAKYDVFCAWLFILGTVIAVIVYNRNVLSDFIAFGNYGYTQFSLYSAHYGFYFGDRQAPSQMQMSAFVSAVYVWATYSLVLLIHLAVKVGQFIYFHLLLFPGIERKKIKVKGVTYEVSFSENVEDPEKYFGLGSVFRIFRVVELLLITFLQLFFLYKVVHFIGGHGSDDLAVWIVVSSLVPAVYLIPYFLVSNRVRIFINRSCIDKYPDNQFWPRFEWSTKLLKGSALAVIFIVIFSSFPGAQTSWDKIGELAQKLFWI